MTNFTRVFRIEARKLAFNVYLWCFSGQQMAGKAITYNSLLRAAPLKNSEYAWISLLPYRRRSKGTNESKWAFCSFMVVWKLEAIYRNKFLASTLLIRNKLTVRKWLVSENTRSRHKGESRYIWLTTLKHKLDFSMMSENGVTRRIAS